MDVEILDLRIENNELRSALGRLAVANQELIMANRELAATNQGLTAANRELAATLERVKMAEGNAATCSVIVLGVATTLLGIVISLHP
jgi:hypothetical protein